MALTIPTNFYRDLGGSDTYVSPLIIIGTYDGNNWVGPSVYIGSEHKKWSSRESLPLLIGSPSIKESIDLNTRSHKINTLNLNFTNIEYGGERLSDRLGDQVTNMEIRMFYYTPDSTGIRFIDLGLDYESKSVLQVYYGKIKSYSYTADNVKITAEDATQEIFDKKLPNRFLSESASPSPKYLNKAIPMVYGHVPKSPCVLSRNDKYIIADLGGQSSLDEKKTVRFMQTDNPYDDGNTWIAPTPTAEEMPEDFSPIQIFTGSHYVYVDKINQLTYGFGTETVETYSKIWTVKINPMTKKTAAEEVDFNDLGINLERGFKGLLWVYDNSSDMTITFQSPFKTKDTGSEYTNEDFEFPNGSLAKALKINKTPFNRSDNLILWYGDRLFNNPAENFWDASSTWVNSDNEWQISGWNERFRIQNDKVYSYDEINLDFVKHGKTYPLNADGTQNTSALLIVEGLLLRLSFNLRPSSYEVTESPLIVVAPYLTPIQVFSLSFNDMSAPYLSTFWHDNTDPENAGSSNYDITAPWEKEWQMIGTNYDSTINLKRPDNGDLVAEQVLTTPYWTISEHFTYGGSQDVFNIINFPDPQGDFSVGDSGHADPEGATVPFQQQNQVTYAASDGVPDGHAFFYTDLTGSNLQELSILRRNLMEDAVGGNYDYYARVKGRCLWKNQAFNSIHDATEGNNGLYLDIIKDMLGELDYDITKITSTSIPDEYRLASHAFTLTNPTSVVKIIEDLSSLGGHIAKFDSFGNFSINHIPLTYDANNLNATINHKDVIDFSFSRTSIDDVYTSIEIKYGWDYGKQSFENSTNEIVQGLGLDTTNNTEDAYLHTDHLTTALSGYNKSYYGFEKERVLIIDDDRGKYVRDHPTAVSYASWLLSWHCNQHLIIKVKLPLKYLHIDAGSIIQFSGLITDVKPYGIDYPSQTTINGQVCSKHFIVTGITKKITHVEFTCVQTHNLQMSPLGEYAGNPVSQPPIDEIDAMFKDLENVEY